MGRELSSDAIATLRAGQEVDGVFACTRKDRLMSRAGTPYLAVELRDRTGAMQGRAFRDADVLAGRFERGDLVRVAGRVERFRDELQLELRSIGRAPRGRGRPGRVPAGRLPRPRRARRLPRAPRARGPRPGPPARCSPRCSATTRCAPSGAARRAPAAATTPTSAACSSTRSRSARSRSRPASLHPRLDSDLLITAALVHDLGQDPRVHLRRRDRPDRRGPAARPRRARPGAAARARGAASARCDDDRRLALAHCVLCHHGPEPRAGRRFGSAEALALYRLNALDAVVKGALEHGLP